MTTAKTFRFSEFVNPVSSPAEKVIENMESRARWALGKLGCDQETITFSHAEPASRTAPKVYTGGIFYVWQGQALT